MLKKISCYFVTSLCYHYRNTAWWQRWPSRISQTMTTTAVQLQPPEPFDFRNPTQWSHWKRRFEQYQVASGLATASQLCQVTTLLYCLGDEANDILATTDNTQDEKVYASVMTKLDGFFVVQKNIIFHQAKFSSLPATQGALNNFWTSQADDPDDPICSQVIESCHSTWPNKYQISLSLRPHWEARCRISVVDDLLLYGSCIVVPASLHISTIEKYIMVTLASRNVCLELKIQFGGQDVLSR